MAGAHIVSPNRFEEMHETARQMSAAAKAFLGSLEPLQRKECAFDIDNDERLQWDYRPVRRAGLSFAQMDGAQQRRGLALLASGLSREGNITALNIMSLEKILAAVEGSGGRHNRNPELYFISIFGTPETEAPWGWRVEGHHLSLNFLIAENKYIACCPQFFGANPAKVPIEPLKGFATLPREEECARRLLRMLDQAQADVAVVSGEAPPDIVTKRAIHVRPDNPVGLAASALQAHQRKVLIELIEVYLARMAPQIADAEMNMLEKEGIGSIHFAWAGAGEPGMPHYYRLHGPSLFVEYDNVQNNANHIHSVWRNLKREWGIDLLRAHYERDHSWA